MDNRKIISVLNQVEAKINMDNLLQFNLHHGAKLLTIMARDIYWDQLEDIYKVTLLLHILLVNLAS